MSNLTKRAIKQSLMELLTTKNLDKITVKDIVLKCAINRNTFYYHYQDIYEVLEDIFNDEVRKQSEEADSFKQALAQAYAFVLNQKKVILNIYESSQRELLRKYLIHTTKELIAHYVLSIEPTIDQEHLDFIVSFYAYAITGSTIEWLSKHLEPGHEAFVDHLSHTFEATLPLLLKSNL